jgi:glycosyltransferase involved in cell wall biosynthesis
MKKNKTPMKPSKKKKIVISLYDDLNNPYYAGGGARVVHALARRLTATYDVVVLTGNYKGSRNSELDGVSYKRIGPDFLGPKLGQLAFQLALLVHVHKQSYDLWIESFTPPFSTSFLPLFTRKPVIGLVQMLSSEDMQRKYKLPFHHIERIGLKQYSHFIVFTDENKKKLQAINKKATYFLHPLGIDTLPGTSSKVQGDHILYLGRIEFDQKGLDLLLEAYHALEDTITTPLVIAGSGNKKDEGKLRQLIKQYHLEKRIVLAGKVSGKEKDALLRKSAVVVIPSRFDSYVLVALEAMAYGKPLVGFAIPGLSWIPKTCIVKVPPFDTAKLAAAIGRVLGDTKLRVTVHNDGRLLSQNYLWDHLFPLYKKSIATVLSRYEA